ncbi:MAG TPA: APC family permease [Acidimicrobiia bacterium]|nr:APC family permease [Acidimicrobiia bacterium]
MTTWTVLKRRVIGRPLATDEEHTQLLPKRLALPVFASDPLSSVAYASEEAMLVLALAGAGAFNLLTPVSLAVATLLAIVIISYRQTIRAYPDGGGAFIVAHENLGLGPGVVAAAALLTDYVLTVAVSVAAGVAAITSALPQFLPWRVELSLAFVALLTLANLRGTKESSKIFALPTYAFVVTVFTMLVVGFLECADGECPRAVSAGVDLEPEVGAITLFLILRAFASGSTALTGVEAIANGVQAFREPKSHNAATTLGFMGLISISMFLGISTLARWFDVRISEHLVDEYGTVISQIGRAAFDGGVGFWILQVVTAGILILAANTAYQDFPRLSAILSRHRLMPRQLRNRGDRLVFSNGIFSLALLAGLLLVIFDAQVSRLIQLYVVGVFTSFTLSQTGMVRHWLTSREAGWRRSVAINAVGATVTGLVLVIVASVKFVHGAWIVIVAVPLLVAAMLGIRRHYLQVASHLRHVPEAPQPFQHRVILLAAHTDAATERALRYAALTRPESIAVVHAVEPEESEDLLHIWERLYPQHPLVLLEADDQPIVRRIRNYIRRERDAHPEARITVILAERLRSRSLRSVFAHPHSLILKALLLFEPGVAVTDLTVVHRRRSKPEVAVPITRHVAVLTVSEVTRPTREALEYAKRLQPDALHCIHIDVDETQSRRVAAAWEREGLDPELEIVSSPFRDIGRPLLRYTRRRRHEEPQGTLVNVLLPEFIVPGRLAQLLHNQTGLAIKAMMAAEPDVAVTSVPFHLAAVEEHQARLSASRSDGKL